MDPHLLRTFVTVAECASFSAAARRLGYTQSAVSQHIATLEDDLGTTLLHRRPVAPTGAGARLLEHAAPILLRLDAARADVRRTAGEPTGMLRVGASALAAYQMGVALGDVRRVRPGLDVVLRVAGRDAVVAGVAAGDLDVGLVDGVAAPTDPLRLGDVGALTTVAVGEEPCVVMLPADHPLAGRAALRLDDLVDARWIDAPDVGAPLADLRAAVGTDGMRGAVRYEGCDVATLVALIAAGHGLAILPARLAKPVGLAGPASPRTRLAKPAGLAKPPSPPAGLARPQSPPARLAGPALPPDRAQPVPPGALPQVPQGTAAAGVPMGSPRLVYRTELVHGHLAGAAVDLAAALTGSFRIRA